MRMPVHSTPIASQVASASNHQDRFMVSALAASPLETAMTGNPFTPLRTRIGLTVIPVPSTQTVGQDLCVLNQVEYTELA